MSNTSWPIDACVSILESSATYSEALGRISSHMGRAVSGSALRNAFLRQGVGSPMSHIANGDGSIDVQIDVDPDPPTSPADLKTWVIWSDAHVPFEDKAAFDLVLEVGRTIRPYGTAIIGDFADLMTVSSHPKAPSDMRWQLRDEVSAVNARLDQIDSWGCKEKKYYKGNHCIRGQRMASKQAPGLYDSLDPTELFSLEKRGWESYKYQQHAPVGDLWLVHDVGYSGKYAAHQNGALFGRSTIQGHTHHGSVVYFGDVFGNSYVSATLGWLGSKEAADYLAPIKVARSWQTSFGIAYEEPSGKTHFQLVPIIGGRCIVNGQLFCA